MMMKYRNIASLLRLMHRTLIHSLPHCFNPSAGMTATLEDRGVIIRAIVAEEGAIRPPSAYFASSDRFGGAFFAAA
ncbi:hypothetical protein MTP99_011388 [Tenebrio molitor]|nr:hypothetical protein MTP99_011388 [Tenebrio molitor]